MNEADNYQSRRETLYRVNIHRGNNEPTQNMPPYVRRRPVIQTTLKPKIAPLPVIKKEVEVADTRRRKALANSMAIMGVAVFVFGLYVSLSAMLTNHRSTAQVAKLAAFAQASADTGSDDGSNPSTTKPSSSAVNSYSVAPDLARYITISKLHVYARVTQVGVASNGNLVAPHNVFDAGWYTGSSKPGTSGAVLIDGHVSSWTTHGVFFGLKNLVPGDTIKITKGDGTVVNYHVVKAIRYDADKVDMQAALTPVTAGKPGLNLITCTGNVKPGTSEFNQRLVVFAEQI